MRCKTKSKVDNNCQDDGTDDARNVRIDVNHNCCKGARGKGDNTNDDGGLCHGLCFDVKD